MINFLKSLFIDLNNSIDKMLLHLDSLNGLSKVASDFKDKTVKALNELKSKIDGIISSGILEVDGFISNNIITYNSINNSFMEIELFRFQAISKYGKPELFFDKLIHKVYDEIQCLQSVPFLSTISNSDTYYWAYPKYNMIALPQGEEKNLLNLSDLYHEIGHLIFQQSEDYLVGDHIPEMQRYYALEKQRIKDAGDSLAFVDDLDEAISYWNSSWSEEFACDLIGTYLVGPAYAWTNMKLSTVSSSYNAVYSDGILFREHPPDEARMRAIFRMLELTGYSIELNEIKQAWNKFLDETQNSKPGSYDLIFPDTMIEAITQNVLKGCKNIGLRSYADQLTLPSQSVSSLINEAWNHIRTSHLTFGDWEAEKLEKLVQL